MIDTIEKEDTIISEEEAAQYDRQIRLWGLDAQKRFVHISSISVYTHITLQPLC